MLGMENLSYGYRLPCRSIAAIRDRFEDALTAHKRGRGVLFLGRKVSGEALVNAAVLAFLELDHQAQHEFLERYLRQFEALIVQDAAEPAKPIHGVPVTTPAKRRRKSS